MDHADRNAPGPGRARDTPLTAALASVRLKMNRQTMRFLGHAGSGHASKGRQPPATATSATTTPPAEGGPTPPRASPRPSTAGEGGERHLDTRVSTTSLARWRRWRARRRAARRSKARQVPRGVGVCCINVRSPSVSVVVERVGPGADDEKPGPTVTRLGPCSKMVIRLRQAGRGGDQQASPAETTGRQAREVQPAESRTVEARPERTSGEDAVEAGPGDEENNPTSREGGQSRQSNPAAASDGERHKPEAGDTRPAASSESLNTYVRRRATSIVQQVAKNISRFERRCGGLEAASSRERLMRQITRVAAYTAASRQLRHAAHLYAVAGITARQARRGIVRYCKIDCPPRPPLPGPGALALPLAAVPLHALHPSRPSSPRPPVADQTGEAVHINDLPKRLLLRVFALLDQRELSLHAAPVCRAWHRLARSRHFWRELTFDAAFHQYSAQSVCQLLRVTPGLWTLELIACRDVDLVLGQVWQTCRQLRTLVLDSCTVSTKLQQLPRQAKEASVLEAVLEHCVCLQYLIVAFTPLLYTSSFFELLGRRCWSLRCFLVSADDGDVRVFCESLSADGGEPESSEASEALLGSLTGSWSRTVPPPACPATTASDNCHAAHPPRETGDLRRRVTAVRTRNHLLRVLALRPDAELRLLQWRMSDKDNRATLDYFGVEARLSFQ